ncbi:unnamed protein product, partial [Rotaria sp. Silwood1]
MSLANELFDCFLIYLSSCDIVQSLHGINEILNLLIYRFIDQIDVSTKKEQWLNNYLLSFKAFITKIKFDHSQIQILFPTRTLIYEYPCLLSMIWTYQGGVNDDICISYLNIFKRKLLALSLKFNSYENDIIYKNIASVLLKDDSLIKSLTLEDNNHNNHSFVWFSLEPNILQLNEYLEELTINLRYVHYLFI